MEDKKTSSGSSGTASGSDAHTNINTQQQPAAHHNNNNNNNNIGGGAKRASSVVENRSSGNWWCLWPWYWLRTNNSVHKASLAVATLLVTSLLVASPVLFLISAVPASDVPPKDCRFLPDDSCLYADGNTAGETAMLGPECGAAVCEEAAERVLAALDTRADPCTDFRRYSCGRWRADEGAHSLADMQRAVDMHLTQLLDKASGAFNNLRLFYKSCVNVKEKPVTLMPSEYSS